MTEVPPDNPIGRPDEFDQFLVEQSAAAAKNAENKAWMDKFYAQLHGFLEAHGAASLWNPDHTVMRRNIQETQDARLDGLDPDHAETEEVAIMVSVHSRASQEHQYASMIAKYRIYQEEGADPAIVAVLKKRLQAELQVEEMPPAWAAAADAYIEGEPFNPAKAADQQILAEVALSLAQPPHDPVVDRLTDIILGPFKPSHDTEDALAADRLALILTNDFILAHQFPERMPTAESHIDEGVRNGAITAEQAVALRSLLHHKPTDPTSN